MRLASHAEHHSDTACFEVSKKSCVFEGSGVLLTCGCLSFLLDFSSLSSTVNNTRKKNFKLASQVQFLRPVIYTGDDG